VPRCGKMFPIVPTSLFGYFGLIISQIRFRKCVIVSMPIIDADFPITDQQADLKIDNLVEHVYLYNISSSVVSEYVGLKFYKYKQKFNGLDTFISNNNIYYIWARSLGGSAGQWVISKRIGNTSGGPSDTVLGNFNSNFFTTRVPIEGSYSNLVTIALAKITSDTR
jgi:hypothetical protein